MKCSFLMIAILGMIFSLTSCVSNKYSLENVTYNIVQEMKIKMDKDDYLAVINNSTSIGSLDAQITTWLETNLLKTGKYRIISRQKIDAVMKEINFGLSGYIDDDTAQSLGKLLGANYILVFDIKTVDKKSFLNIQVLETETAILVYSNNLRVNISNDNIQKQKPFRF